MQHTTRVPAATAAPFVIPGRRAILAALAALVLAACGDLPMDPISMPPPSSGAEGGATSPPSAPPIPNANPMAGATFWVDPGSRPQQQVNAWRQSRPADAREMEKIATQPQAVWFGDWNAEPRRWVDEVTTRITAAGAMPVYVLYNIPQRDCGLYSAGGASSDAAYTHWVQEVARGINGRRAVVVLEPDALAGLDCLSAADQERRYTLLRQAVQTLVASGPISVYIDAGNARWHPADRIAERLRRVGVDQATGFALNVSNFLNNDENVRYGNAVSDRVGGKHFVVDTSRNGLGPTADLQWCNPAGRALGTRPTMNTGQARVDAYLWIKAPGESDGTCNGGPGAGQWWAEYALGLAQRA
jgi:endoglucanase